MSNSSALERIGEILSPTELGLVGTALVAGQPTVMAISGIAQKRAIEAREHLNEVLLLADKKFVGTALIAMSVAAKKASSEMEVVWSGPMPHDALGRTTWGVLGEVVQSAHEFVYAATYSAGVNAPATVALQGALARGVDVTCLVDWHHRKESVEILQSELAGARFIYLDEGADVHPPLMHAKFIVVDGRSTFLTSANFSNIAVEKSLEVGLLVHNTFVAHQFKRRIDDLLSEGQLKVLR